MNTLTLAAAAAALLSSSALADVGAEPAHSRLISHNGSLMEFTPLPGRGLEIHYVRPRPGLWGVGVLPGTLLLRGAWSGQTLFATAYVFSAQCGASPYQVSGQADVANVLTLSGLAPVIDPYTCGEVGSAPTLNSVLVFEPLPVQKPPGPGGSCPNGYSSSGSYCTPGRGAPDAVAKPPNGTCPTGWYSSGSFCLRSGSR